MSIKCKFEKKKTKNRVYVLGTILGKIVTYFNIRILELEGVSEIL